MRKVNRIGLEAEFFLHGKGGELLFPGEHGFSTDEYVILGEFRANPGETVEEALGNFMQSLSKVRRKAAKKELTISFGYEEITPEFKAKILRKMGTKVIQQCKNVYGTDILSLSDDVVEHGKLTKSLLSVGLHVHFSKEVLYQNIIDGKEYTSKYYILTPSQRKKIIVAMDRRVLPSYDLGITLKYRNKGFYESKSYGFEYRSLPMCDEFTTIDHVESLLETSFGLLEDLDK